MSTVLWYYVHSFTYLGLIVYYLYCKSLSYVLNAMYIVKVRKNERFNDFFAVSANTIFEARLSCNISKGSHVSLSRQRSGDYRWFLQHMVITAKTQRTQRHS